MQIGLPKTHFKVPHKTLGIAMQSYYGGRAECRIRKTKVPVIHTDFTSQYLTVNALLGNWDILKVSSIHFEDCTNTARRILSGVKLNSTFDPTFWKKLSFFVMVKPQNDILPVRTVYGGKTQNIGLNFLRLNRPIWYAGPDAVASTLLTGNPPRILKAIRMVARGRQSRLQNTNLGGMVGIDPKNDDLKKANLKNANLSRDNVGGSTQLQGADLTGAKVGGANFEGAEYDETVFPEGFDPKKHKMISKSI